jgi:hypothetical protein
MLSGTPSSDAAKFSRRNVWYEVPVWILHGDLKCYRVHARVVVDLRPLLSLRAGEQRPGRTVRNPHRSPQKYSSEHCRQRSRNSVAHSLGVAPAAPIAVARFLHQLIFRPEVIMFRRLAITFLLAAAAASARVVVGIAPPPVIVETPVPAPGPGYVWTPGYYRWDGRAYVWVPGGWVVAPFPAARWAPHHWVHRGLACPSRHALVSHFAARVLQPQPAFFTKGTLKNESAILRRKPIRLPHHKLSRRPSQFKLCGSLDRKLDRSPSGEFSKKAANGRWFVERLQRRFHFRDAIEYEGIPNPATRWRPRNSDFPIGRVLGCSLKGARRAHGLDRITAPLIQCRRCTDLANTCLSI